jgi:hypothetical protein
MAESCEVVSVGMAPAAYICLRRGADADQSQLIHKRAAGLVILRAFGGAYPHTSIRE